MSSREILSTKQVFEEVKNFLELVQPLKVTYGYPRGVKRGTSFITYQHTSSTPTTGIGNSLIAERLSFLVTIQTKSMEQCLLYKDMVILATDRTPFKVLSQNTREDVTVEAGWICTIILVFYNNLTTPKGLYTREEFREILQQIADRYIYLTTQYKIDGNVLDPNSLVIPDLKKKNYSLYEMLKIKKRLFDKLLLETTEY